jgi:hypothetical protein
MRHPSFYALWLVLPSLFEASLVLLEAPACRLGVVQSANTGMGATWTTGVCWMI